MAMADLFAIRGFVLPEYGAMMQGSCEAGAHSVYWWCWMSADCLQNARDNLDYRRKLASAFAWQTARSTIMRSCVINIRRVTESIFRKRMPANIEMCGAQH